VIFVWFQLKGKQMKYSSLLAALIASCLTACSQKPADAPPPQAPFVASVLAPSSSVLPAGHPALNGASAVGAGKMAPNAPEPPPLTQKAQVLSVINVAQYSYLEVKQDNQTRWLATTTTPAKKGDTIQFDTGTLMTNFTSKVLNRTFPSISFVGRVVVSDGKS
jgi:hypothetical protein